MFIVYSCQKYLGCSTEDTAAFSAISQHKKQKQVQSGALITILDAMVAGTCTQHARYRKEKNTLGKNSLTVRALQVHNNNITRFVWNNSMASRCIAA
ncbi:hypothetical protein [Type-D symbiont of Plautia stali]|uniref:hypothetical protein n=1 Tax=Type-D symbiont of Plautia stali TaxID=1560356 RepID=UPI00128FB719|nr:hypothetical protein [Type-D symbiont of Plautia stali]